MVRGILLSVLLAFVAACGGDYCSEPESVDPTERWYAHIVNQSDERLRIFIDGATVGTVEPGTTLDVETDVGDRIIRAETETGVQVACAPEVVEVVECVPQSGYTYCPPS